MQFSTKIFSTKIDGFEQKDSQGFENSHNSYEQYPLEKFFIFTIYQNYTLALKVVRSGSQMHIKLWSMKFENQIQIPQGAILYCKSIIIH